MSLAGLVLCCSLLLTARGDDPPRLEPMLDAAPHKAWAWTSAGGLRYTWVLPKDLAQGEKRDLVVILHGSGLDYRWGAANYKPGEFRPNDFVVSVDGPSKGPEDTRLFLGREEDVAAFEAFLDEIKTVLPARRVLLYGHSQGGFFVVYFAGEKPDQVDGVVAHASGAWNWSKIDEFMMDVPIVFLHGTADAAVPFGQSIGSRDHYQSAGHGMTALRRMPGYNHWPNAIRASECLDWCLAIRTAEPQEALAVAESFLERRPADEYNYICPPWYSGAAAILQRFKGEGDTPIGDSEPPGAEGRALELLARIEAEGEKHVSALKEHVKAPADLKLDGRPWLGHLVSVREDFRGVAPIETYASELNYDELAREHFQAAGELTRVWYQQASDRAIFETAVRVLPRCFLVEGLPTELSEHIPKAFERAQELRIGGDAIKRYRNFVMWRAGWDEGLKAYERVWSQWK